MTWAYFDSQDIFVCVYSYTSMVSFVYLEIVATDQKVLLPVPICIRHRHRGNPVARNGPKPAAGVRIMQYTYCFGDVFGRTARGPPPQKRDFQ